MKTPKVEIPKLDPNLHYLMFNGVRRHEETAGLKGLKPSSTLIVSFDKVLDGGIFEYYVGEKRKESTLPIKIGLYEGTKFIVNTILHTPRKQINSREKIVCINEIKANNSMVFYFQYELGSTRNLPNLDLKFLHDEFKYFDHVWSPDARNENFEWYNNIAQIFKNFYSPINTGVLLTTPVRPSEDGKHFVTVNGRKIDFTIDWIIDKVKMDGFWNTGIDDMEGIINQTIKVKEPYLDYKRTHTKEDELHDLMLSYAQDQSPSHPDLKMSVLINRSINGKPPFYGTPMNSMVYLTKDKQGRHIYLISYNNDLSPALRNKFIQPYSEDERINIQDYLRTTQDPDKKTLLHILKQARGDHLNPQQGLVAIDYNVISDNVENKTQSLLPLD